MKVRILSTGGHFPFRADFSVVSCLYHARLFFPHFCFIAAITLMIGCGGSSGDTSSEGGGQTALPPDPGPAGLATLAGIDSNSNGVRDDVERYIALTYPSSSEAGTRSALTQYTKATQATLSDATDTAASKLHMEERIKALQCLHAKRPADANKLFAELRAQILNTKSRSTAYVMAESQLGGFTLPLPSPNQRASACSGP